jgi:hypothetical protein
MNKSWTVTLIAKGNGMSDTLSKQVDVFNTNIKFDTNINSINQYAPLTVNFLNNSEIHEGDTLSYSWEFGDGEESDSVNPVHTYTEPGTYDITLTGLKSNGCELTYGDFITVKDSAQKGEFEFITSSCLREIEKSSYNSEKHFYIKDGILTVYGYYSANCGTHKTATLRCVGDSVYIQTWEEGPLATCSCSYCFEIKMPIVNQDSIVVFFNNQLVPLELSGIKNLGISDFDLKVVPNPVHDVLTLAIQNLKLSDCEYTIFDMNGRIVQKGGSSRQNQIKIEFTDRGIYFIQIRNNLDKTEYLTIYKGLKKTVYCYCFTIRLAFTFCPSNIFIK